MCISHSRPGSSRRSEGVRVRSEPSTARSNSATLAVRAGSDSWLKGESGLVGSAAFLKNLPANAW